MISRILRCPEQIGKLLLLVTCGEVEFELCEALPLDTGRQGACGVGNGMLEQGLVLDNERQESGREGFPRLDDCDVS